LKSGWIVIGRLDESLRDKLIKNSSLMRLQIRGRTCQQIAKHRNVWARKIICHQIRPR
jgi:hypothetical protein